MKCVTTSNPLIRRLGQCLLVLFCAVAASTDAQFNLVGWGDNDNGQSNTPAGPFLDVAAGTAHNVAIRSDRTLVSWGRDLRGAVSATPSGQFMDVAAGGWGSVAIDMSGQLVVWGGHAAGPSGVYVEVVSGTYHSVAFRPDRTIVAWGDNQFGQLNVPAGPFAKVSAGPYHNVGLRPDGTVECWGANSQGQSNNPPGKFIAVAAGAVHSVGVREDGTLVAWGWNGYGQLQKPAGTFTAVAAGAHHSIAIRTDGSLVGWGYNAQQQIDCPPGTYTRVYAGWFHSMAAAGPDPWRFASLHPPGASYSAAWAAGDGQIAGAAALGAHLSAVLWTGLTASSLLDLSPDGVDSSEIWDVEKGVQVGSGSVFALGSQSVGVWTGESSSWTPMPPTNQSYGNGAGTDGINHVGSILGSNGQPAAALWSGVFPYMRTSLHPAGANSSWAWDVANGLQVGEVRWPTGFGEQNRATVWYGDANNRVEIHPIGASWSAAYRTDGFQHVGVVDDRAALWTSNATWVDLTPLGYASAGAYNLGFGHQVGWVDTIAGPHAAFWSGTAESYEDLHQALPPEFAGGESYAWDLDVRDGKLVVVGEARNTVSGHMEAVIWIRDLPNQPPVAVVPDGGIIETGDPTSTTAFITLDGSGSHDPDGDDLVFHWTSVPEHLIQVGDAPIWIVQASPGTYSFTLTVTDPSGASDSKTVSYTVVQSNRAPVANAGPDQNVTVPHDGSPLTRHVTVTLDGGASSDPDGDPLQYVWSGPNGFFVTVPSIEATLEPGTHTFTLRVTDPDGLWSEDTVAITVLPEPNQPPVVDAGPDLVLYCPKGETRVWFVLRAEATDPDDDTVQATWFFPGFWGNNPVSTFRNVGTHAINAYARDSYGVVVSDEIVVTVLPAPTGNPPGPRPEKDSVEVVEGGSAFVDLLANDSHSEGEPIYYLGGGLENGYWGTWHGQGRFTITPPAWQPPGNYEISYYVRDDQGRTAGSRLKLKIKKK